MIISETQYKMLPERLQKLFTKQPNPSRDEVVELFPNTKGSKASGLTPTKARSWKNTSIAGINRTGFDDDGSASRFFYCAKASKSERNKGCEELEKWCNHPTVKPIALMEYLVKLVSKEDAIILDPFTGSGSTLIACKNLWRNYIWCEMNEEYIQIADARLSYKTGKEKKSENSLFQ